MLLPDVDGIGDHLMCCVYCTILPDCRLRPEKQKVQLAVTLIYGDTERVISYGGDKSNKKVNSGRDTFIILTCKYHASGITLFAFTATPRWINNKSRHALGCFAKQFSRSADFPAFRTPKFLTLTAFVLEIEHH